MDPPKRKKHVGPERALKMSREFEKRKKSGTRTSQRYIEIIDDCQHVLKVKHIVIKAKHVEKDKEQEARSCWQTRLLGVRSWGHFKLT